MVAVFVLVAAGAAWRFRPSGYPVVLGRTFDPVAALGVAQALDRQKTVPDERLVVQGRVSEVCRSAGCWFVLREIQDGRLYELFVDLKKNEQLSVRGDASGRLAFVTGKFVSSDFDIVFEADGVRVE